MSLFPALLTWASGLSALLALGVYFYVIARRPQWIRLLNGSGLFFSGLALSLIAVSLPKAAERGMLFTMAVGVALLIASILAQSASALRNRRAWDGVERRRDADKTQAEGPAE